MLQRLRDALDVLLGHAHVRRGPRPRHVGRIEITVHRNDGPGEIARLVSEELVAMKRNRSDLPS